MDAVIPKAFGSMYSTMLTVQQRGVSKSIQKTLGKMNFNICSFVNKQTGERCTRQPALDRKTGTLSKYCYPHKSTQQKNDRIKFLDAILAEQPELIRRETENQRQERRSRRSSRSAGPSPNVTSYNSPTTSHKPANPQLPAKSSEKHPAVDDKHMEI